MAYVTQAGIIDDVVVGGVDSGDYPDFCDAYIESAVWAESGDPLTDDELDHLHELAQELARIEVVGG